MIINFTTIELKLIKKALLNQKMGKGEEKIVEGIYNKIAGITTVTEKVLKESGIKN